ncbi:MAG: acetyl-CoA C-acetyltransferase [Parvibaculales bacterium]
MRDAFIIDTARTPRSAGKVGKGKLAELHPHLLLSTTLKALSDRNGFDTADVDDVIAGCGSQRSTQGYCIGRMGALDAGWDNDATGISIDRFCGSGLTSVNLAAMGIMSGMQDLTVGGGVEMMSLAPTFTDAPNLVDSNNMHLRDIHPQPHQGVCADVIASMEGITREAADAFGAESQKRAAHAIENGHFDKSLVPVHDRDGSLVLDHEDFVRPGTTVEALAELSPSFVGMYDYPMGPEDNKMSCREMVEKCYPDVKVEHIHHAGNSSGVVDGAASVLLASEDYAQAHGLKPRARIVAMANAACEPELMLNAPVPAARKVLEKAGMTLDDIDLFEINEAFAVVAMKFIRDLDLNPDCVNVNGGAIALGHPIGATGSVLVGTLLDEMERRDVSTGLVTMCTGGGMAPALILERV